MKYTVAVLIMSLRKRGQACSVSQDTVFGAITVSSDKMVNFISGFMSGGCCMS